jgi:uncharacterized protein YjbI with pentapeptide repeats
MALSFVGQDLRHQSFRGRTDLAGADFTGADLRGCDFREAILTGANFTGVTTGQSYKQFIYLIVLAVEVAFMGVVVGLAASLGLVLGAIVGGALGAIAGSVLGGFLGVVAIAIVVVPISFLTAFIVRATDGPGIVSVDIAMMSERTCTIVITIGITVVVTFQSYSSFLSGNISLGILCSTASLVFIAITMSESKELLKTLKSSEASTYFNGADLVNANFANAELQFTDFTDANCDLVNWQGVKFRSCNLPKSIKTDQVRYLCKNPDKGRGENFTSSDFRNTYLQNVDLVDAILHNANLNGADLRGAKLINADLSNSQALGTDFSGATLTGACIDNWGINSNTKFDDIVCDYIFLSQKIDENGNLVYDPESRKPANGNFQQGDFAKLMRQYQDGLDLIFRNGDDPKTFAFALQKLMDEYEDAQLQFGGLQNLGDGDIVLRLTVGNSKVPKSKLHSFFTETKKIAQSFFSQDSNQNLQKLESEIKQLKKDLANKDRQLESSLVRTKYSTSDNAKVGNNFSLISVIVQDSMFGKKTDIKAGGDVSGVADGNISGVAGKDLKGVAGRDISGQVTITIQELRDSNIPEAPKLADLLTDLQKAISESTELAEPDKEKALKYLDKIGQLANDKEADRDMISMAIDGILNVVSKAAKLLTPVQAITDGLRKILQL